VAKLLDDKTLRATFGQKGATRVREHFIIEEMAKKNEECYYAMLRGAA